MHSLEPFDRVFFFYVAQKCILRRHLLPLPRRISALSRPSGRKVFFFFFDPLYLFLPFVLYLIRPGVHCYRQLLLYVGWPPTGGFFFFWDARRLPPSCCHSSRQRSSPLHLALDFFAFSAELSSFPNEGIRFCFLI